jgi:hypothetical protein
LPRRAPSLLGLQMILERYFFATISHLVRGSLINFKNALNPARRHLPPYALNRCLFPLTTVSEFQRQDRHQLLVLNRGRKRAPNLRTEDRIIAGLRTLFMRPARVLR